MEKKLKVVFISCIPTPHWLKFVPHLRQYVDAEFYYYEPGNHGRPDWWLMDLGEHSHVMDVRPWRHRYYTLKPILALRKEHPDVVVLGGFTDPSNFLAYCWARLHGCKTIIGVERLRNSQGQMHQKMSFAWRVVRFLYRNIDLVGVTAMDAVQQLADVYKFRARAIYFPYPADLDSYFAHPIRERKPSYTLIFPNSLINRYDPILGIEIFNQVLKRYPLTRLKMCGYGNLRTEVEILIKKYGIGDSVEFLDHFKCWEDMGKAYKESDIMYLSARWSNGNYSISECRASGMACIISDKVQGPSGKMMVENSSGAVVPHAVQPFVEKICWYIEHPEEFARIAPINRELLRPNTYVERAKLYNRVFQSLFPK